MNGLLGKALSIANQYVEAALVPNDVAYGTISIIAVNPNGTPANFKVALTTIVGPTPDPVDHIEEGSAIPENGGKYREECVLVSPGERVMVWSDQPNVRIRVGAVFEAASAP